MSRRPPEGAAPAEPPARDEIRVKGALDDRWSACSPRSATWAWSCCRSAASTKTANPDGANGAAASQPDASAPDPTVPADPDA
jgi:hypothetical protein